MQVISLEEAKEMYKPKVLITVYETDAKLDRNSRFYLESHDVDPKGRVSAGRPLAEETVEQIAEVFFDTTKNIATVSGLMPANLLSFTLLPGGNYRMIWYRPEEMRVMHHKKQLKLPTDKAWVPPTLYMVERRELSVFALCSNDRPDEKTPLMIAPYFNTDDDGDVCMGNAKVEKPRVLTFQNVMKYWEDMFWLSEFTHENGGKKFKGDLDMQEVWAKFLRKKNKPRWVGQFCDQLLQAELKSNPSTLKDLL